MKNLRLILKILLLLNFYLHSANALAQVKIGTNPTNLNPDAVLELESVNKGLVLPRLGLLATTNPHPLSAFTAGMFVYDTATAGDVTPGLYYCDGTRWVRVNNSSVIPAPGGGWTLKGNQGTNPDINFIGTSDNNDLVFKTNGIERLRLTKDGWLGVGTTNPQAALHVKGSIKIDSIQAGDVQTDSILVADANGMVKSVNRNNFLMGMKKTSIVTAATGQAKFETPAVITDPDRILLYRNGVLINFTVEGNNSIVPEVACICGDEIKIIQFL